MNKHLRILGLALAVFGLLWAGGDYARGFSYFSYGGYTVIWANGQALRYLSPGTFPQGSDTDILIQASMGQWSTVPGAGFQFSYIRLTEDPEFIDNYDGYSDTAAVPSEWLDPGVLGVTYMVNSYDLWYDMDILFSDFPENVGWHMLTNPDCEVTTNPTPDYGFSFYIVALHELGHGIGLGHDPIGDEPAGSPWFIGTMNPGYPAGGPVGQENVIELHTDDRNGTSFLYPGTPATMLDIANASYCSQGPNLGKVVPIFVDPPSVAPGEELTAWSVLENFGTVSVSDVRQGYYLSLDDVVGTDDLPVGDLLWDLPAGDGYEFSVAVDLPDLVAGTYYIGSILDDLDEVTEVYEDNNHAIICEPFTLEQGLPSFPAYSQRIIDCDEPFVTSPPVLAYPINAAPVTWSLDNPQPGMVIDEDTGAITWPNPIKSPFLYDIDVRATNGAGSFVQTLELGVHQAAPAIVPISNKTTTCGINYIGPTPVLTAPSCMAPILSWSLVQSPAGMEINPSSGVVFWPDAVPGAVPHTVTIRAVNAEGEATESWLLYVDSANGDLDVDGFVGLSDYAELESCLTGPSAEILTGCECADFDQDDDVDLADFARQMNAFHLTEVFEGACCFSDGNCSVVSPEDCYLLDGSYRGHGTTCAGVECTGACCFYTGGCLTFIEDNCDVAGGTFQGMGTDCGDLTCPASGEGACCLSDESCIVTTLSGCLSSDGDFRGVGLACEVADCTTPTGACCHTDGTCSEGTEDDCDATGGSYIGDSTWCTPDTCQGACCYPDGGCLDLSSPDCAVTGGIFQGPGTDCATTDCPIVPTGACCYADESCGEETEVLCLAHGGSYQGDDTLCAETDCTAAARGACCLPDESCVEATVTACAWTGGTFIGETTTCAEVDCSLSDIGACWDPVDWSCSETSSTICAALFGTFEGAGTTCAATTAPEYGNDIAEPTTFLTPGAGKSMGDDLVLSGTARGAIYYDLAVYGTGGGTYSVTVGLYTDCPGEGGTLIAGTDATWNAVPADDYIYTLSLDLPEPVRLPDEIWMVATFSTANSGWVLAEEAEVGFTDDLYGDNAPSWVCDYWFGGSPNDYAGFWANVQCVDLPEAEGACCHADESCTEGTVSACDVAGGLFMGEDTDCGSVDCTGLDLGACCDVLDWSCTLMSEADCLAAGGSFDGEGTPCTDACPEYGNEIDPITLSYNPGQPMGDDLELAGTARDLSYFEIAVYGGGGGAFDVSTMLYDGSPCAGGQQMPATLVTGSGLPDGQVLNLNVTFPTPITLPDEVWLVVEFSNAYAGWIVAGEAEAGYTADYFGLATYNGGSGQWDWVCTHQISDPPNDPHAGFWTHLQCVDGGRGSGGSGGGRPIMTVTPSDVNPAAIRLAHPRPAGEVSPSLLDGATRDTAPGREPATGIRRLDRHTPTETGLTRIHGTRAK